MNENKGDGMMAKMLTKIWKTTKGVFLETEREALERERLDAIIDAATAAHSEGKKENNEALLKYYSERDLRDQSRILGNTYPELPQGFVIKLAEKLEQSGLLKPIKLSGE